MLQVFCFVGCAQNIGVGRVGLFRGHFVGEARLGHERGHLGASAELVDESVVKPGLVHLKTGIDEQTVAVEALDVVALKGGAVAPDVDVVFLHGGDQHGAGDGAANRRGIEVCHACSADVEGAGLERGDAFAHERAAAVDEAGLFRAVLERLARDVIVVGFVGLAEVGSVGVGDRALQPHPMQGGGGVEPAGEGNANLLADGQGFENHRHAWKTSEEKLKRQEARVTPVAKMRISSAVKLPRWPGRRAAGAAAPSVHGAGSLPDRRRSTAGHR